MEIDFNSVKMPTKTPKVARKIVCCTVEYDDGSVLELPVEDEQGFHRTSDFSSKGKQMVIHEVFISYTKVDNE